jgi:Family of unknown function (DUF5522)
LQEGIDYTIEDGKYVFTRNFLIKRGYCCHLKCRNCPYTNNFMEKELFINNDTPRKYFIQHDDLKYDGKNLIIPGYWANTISEYIKNLDESKIAEDDKQDLETFKNFIFDVEYFKNSGN